MSKTTSWTLIATMTAISVLILGFVATYRFAMPLVYRGDIPTPDYEVQALIAGTSIIVTLTGGVAAGIHATRHKDDRRRIVGWAAAALTAGTALGTILAFTLSAQ
ncbi:hypothetical protein [Mycetocola zhadangensis]|uniref:Uncharacterized protein n=1 Tax=Mycetocola zhadangensis TaxID=1164595 RepID=A0A3L7J602_9MICO|nr:hypothetical protein [Mycetocola zhadangensis]RLQ85940.1 hypothetical protein D9V28_03595 [Mycetocola zhadangensis]GGE87110.1 hypothetical protein GCM10011313_07050 [Mycetocola zhadangensis]